MTRPSSNGHTVVDLSQLLALPLPYEEVELPEYEGKKVRLNAVTGLERERLTELSEADENGADNLEFQHELIASSMGGDVTPEDVGKLPSTVIDRLTVVALRLAGIEAEAVRKAMAGLGAAPPDGSG